ncbi:hypothetical protein AV530_001900 [Patagioenas fasciata monilis]|uniref:Uncharacterized protein n=1 Tax=Patagioenas fasciata monilis TaxID=372326 RepID=A0A1V4J5Z9_PATFA|nr:hypothetical protein AV530_001900 [Patagioenas fasciata monilis]
MEPCGLPGAFLCREKLHGRPCAVPVPRSLSRAAPPPPEGSSGRVAAVPARGLERQGKRPEEGPVGTEPRQQSPKRRRLKSTRKHFIPITNPLAGQAGRFT